MIKKLAVVCCFFLLLGGIANAQLATTTSLVGNVTEIPPAAPFRARG